MSAINEKLQDIELVNLHNELSITSALIALIDTNADGVTYGFKFKSCTSTGDEIKMEIYCVAGDLLYGFQFPFVIRSFRMEFHTGEVFHHPGFTDKINFRTPLPLVWFGSWHGINVSWSFLKPLAYKPHPAELVVPVCSVAALTPKFRNTLLNLIADYSINDWIKDNPHKC